MRKGGSFPQCFGPYLRYAISDEFRIFEPVDKSKLFFLVEFKEAKFIPVFEREMAKYAVEMGPANDKTRYRTVRSGQAAVRARRALDIWDAYVSRVELSLPLTSLAAPGPLAERWKKAKRSQGSRLIGVLDYGCPFAAAHFLGTALSPNSTRVLAIWDQDQGTSPVPVKDSLSNPCLFGQALTDFTYGLEYRRESAPPGLTPRQMGLDEWTQLHSTPTGSIDEDGCYADTEFKILRRRQSHGAHVTDLFAGRFPASSRVGPSGPGQDRRDPPSWKAGTDPACSADVVFVQFSEACIRDHTGVWLKAYVEDAIRYIVSYANPLKSEPVVINLSYGPTTGPHDGTSELEVVLTALVAEFDGSPGKPKLEIVLAAGNAYLTDGHVVFKGANPTNDAEWVWRLLPDNSVLCFAEVWMNLADAGGVAVTLTPPSGAPAALISPSNWGSHKRWRLEVGPTISAPGTAAREHGDWKIKVTGVGANAEVHAYVARTDPNMDVRTGAKRSYFVDAQWEQTRAAAARHTRQNGEFDKSGSLVRRDGTLNGLATGQVARVHVAGGYMLANRRGSPYSSAGPARSGLLPLRKNPDLALPCDESYALRGMRGGGNRSGGVFRLIGTSAAAPQLARHIANGTTLTATNPPAPNSKDEAKRGAGNIKPP